MAVHRCRRPPIMRMRRKQLFGVLILLVPFVGAQSDNPTQGELPQNLVPPFQRRPHQDGIPLFIENLRDGREFLFQDTFHSLDVQGGKPNSHASTTDDLFKTIREKSAIRATSVSNSGGASVKRSLLRGLFPTSLNDLRYFSGRSNRLLSFSSENDYVVTGEVDYKFRNGRHSSGTDADDTNSTDMENDTLEDGNFTSDDGYSVVTKSNATSKSISNTSRDESTDYRDQAYNGHNDTDESSSATIRPGGQNKTSPELHQPIRIRAVLSELLGGGQHLDPFQRQILLEDILQPALLAWSEALRVPVGDPLKNLTLDSTQWLDGKTCGPGIGSGLPTAHVPLNHLLYGIPGTDLVVYLNLGFVYETTPAPSPSTQPPTRIGTDRNKSVSPTSMPSENLYPSYSSRSSKQPVLPLIAPTGSGKADQPVSPNSRQPVAPSIAPTGSGDVEQTFSPNSRQPVSSSSAPLALLQSDEPSASPSSNPPTGLGSTAPRNSLPGELLNSTNTSKFGWNSTSPPAQVPALLATHTPAQEPTLPVSYWPSSSPSQSPTKSPDPKPQCAGDYLASSMFCSTNELDRPTAALLHICIGPDFFDPIHLPRNIITIMHELGHVLGFNLQSLAHFRRSDGSPITKRDSTGAIPKTWVQCTGPQLPKGRPRARMQLPSPEILKFRDVRRGVRVAEVVTPSVAQVVRNHFDCQELLGAELESGEALPLSTNPGEMSCIGDHWERRLFKMDIMNPLVEELSFDPLISILTLAYFADSGWYQVDLSRAAFPAIWGRAAGCAFVEEPCIQPNGQLVSGSDELFCNSVSNIDDQGYVTTLDGCTPDLTRKAACTMSQYDGELPAQYQYFSLTYGSNVGGQDAFMDYCPVYNGLKNGLCSDPSNEAILRVSTTERVGSPNSRCLSSYSTPSGSRLALCLRIACVVQDKSLRVQVEGKWHTCSFEGQVISSNSGKESILCPNPVRVCPTFYCPLDCLGTNRFCNFTLGECVPRCTAEVGGETVVVENLADGSCPDFENATDPLIPDGSDEGEDNFSGPGQVQTDSPFLIPAANATQSPGSGSPLSDIYFPDERTLEEEDNQQYGLLCHLKGNGRWFCLIGLLLFVLPALLVRKKRKGPGAASDDDHDGGGGPARSEILSSQQRRNKEKMIATVLVDLRMNDPNVRIFRDVLVQRGSETDRSMTDTDPGSFIPWEERSRDYPQEELADNSGIFESSTALGGSVSGELDNRPFGLTSEGLPVFVSGGDNDMDMTTPTNSAPIPRGSATIRRRFFRNRNSRLTTRYRASATDTLRL